MADVDKLTETLTLKEVKIRKKIAFLACPENLRFLNSDRQRSTIMSVTFQSMCQQDIWDDEAETKKVMSQKCIGSMYFRTIFCDTKNVDFTGVALLQNAIIRTVQAGGILGIRGLLVHALSIEARAIL